MYFPHEYLHNTCICKNLLEKTQKATHYHYIHIVLCVLIRFNSVKGTTLCLKQADIRGHYYTLLHIFH